MSPSEPGPTGSLFNVDEWAALPKAVRGELVDGRLEDEEVPDMLHEVIVVWFASMLRAWVAPLGGFVAGSGAKFALGPTTGRKPDVSMFLPGRVMPPRRGAVCVAPDLMVEVISPSPRDVRCDRIAKPDEYAAFGVKHYWLVDPDARRLECFVLGEGGSYVRVFGASGGQVEIPGLVGLVLQLDDLWAETDRLGAE